MAYGKAGDWYLNNENGGGGSSDFSTAEVTVTYTGNDVIRLYAPFYFEAEGYDPFIEGWMKFDSEEPTFTGKVVVPSSGELIIGSSLTSYTSSNTQVTGNARVERGSLIVTGDCTITIS